MKGLVLGTAGHVDHGKTSLIRALTGVDTDRLEEEKRRGLTIDIGFAHLDLDPGLEIGVVDVPGHEDFVRNMLTGCTGIDFVLLVVAADEGPMPQTREHLAIAHLLGVRHGVVALNKVDRVDAAWRELVREATAEELKSHTASADWPIVDVSAVTGEGLDELRGELRAVARAVDGRDPGDIFRMPVDRSFSVAGAGTVVTGTVWSGAVTVGDTVRALPAGTSARVRSLQVHGGERERVGPGRRCAMALVGVEPTAVPRGTTIVGGMAWKPCRRLGARVEVPVESPRELSHGQRVRLFLGTGEVMARVLTEDREPVRPGQETWVVLECESPLVPRVGDRFVLRFFSPVTTIGGGRVADLDPPRRWRDRGPAWEDVLSGEDARAVTAAIRTAGGWGLTEDELPLLSGVVSPTAARILHHESGARRVGGRWYGESVLRRGGEALVKHLDEAHRTRPRVSGEPLESVRAALSNRLGPEAVDEVVAELAADGKVVVRGPTIRLPSHRPALTPAEERALDSLRSVLADAGLEPPPPAALSARLGVRREVFQDLLKLLLERGEVVAVTPEIYITSENEADARSAIRRVLREGEARSPGDFRAELGLTRKYLIPLLEHMDRQGVTRRAPEGRLPGER